MKAQGSQGVKVYRPLSTEHGHGIVHVGSQEEEAPPKGGDRSREPGSPGTEETVGGRGPRFLGAFV